MSSLARGVAFGRDCPCARRPFHSPSCVRRSNCIALFPGRLSLRRSLGRHALIFSRQQQQQVNPLATQASKQQQQQANRSLLFRVSEMAMDSEMAAASEEAPDSQVDGASDSEMTLNSVVVDGTPDSVDVVLDSVELAPDSKIALNSVEVDGAPDSVDIVPDSIEVAPDLEMALNSIEVDGAPVSVESLCARCGTFHTDGVFGEACFQARLCARSCARCGLLHEDYDLPARWLHDMEKFDCEIYILDVEKLQMDGNTIILPEQVIKKLEEHIGKKKQAKTSKGD